MYRQVEVSWVLLAAGANPNIVDGTGSTPLHYAAKAGMHSTVTLLLAKNADASFKDGKTGRTPREWALEKGHQDVAALLLSPLRNE
jgi:ankyrin repeat protein